MVNEIVYDCINFVICDHKTREENSLCWNCANHADIYGYGWGVLQYKDCDEECDVCLNRCDKKLIFPAGCGHAFCIECSYNILHLQPKEIIPLSVEPFGGPSCPNGCVNPEIGDQCFCSELDDEIEAWREANESQWYDWCEAEDNYNDNLERPYSSRGCGVCPLCRSECLHIRECKLSWEDEENEADY
jgi:hypothetical protein